MTEVIARFRAAEPDESADAPGRWEHPRRADNHKCPEVALVAIDISHLFGSA